MSESASVMRSVGRIRTIVEATSIAWVMDVRDLKRDVLVRLQNPWQANPGDLLEYELKRSAGEASRWHGEDVVFNHNLSLGELVGMAAKGLSECGQKELLRLLATDPVAAHDFFKQPLPEKLLAQLLAWSEFPLPSALVTRLLDKEATFAQAAARLLTGGKADDGLLKRVVAFAPVAELDTALLEALKELEGMFPLDLASVQGGARRVIGWLRDSQDLRFLALLDPLRWTDEQLNSWLSSNTVFAAGEMTGLWAAWLEGLDTASASSFLKRIWLDSRSQKLTVPQALRDTEVWRGMLAAEAKGGEAAQAARDELTGGALSPELALQFLLDGIEGQQQLECLGVLAKAGQLPDIAGADALSLYHAAELLAEDDRLNLRANLATHGEIAEKLSEWLGASDTRELALDGLSALPSFDRGLLQRLLSTPMSPRQRSLLAAAITRRSPERWQERYLLDEDERALWLAAGAPF
jgi:hypothetical protein